MVDFSVQLWAVFLFSHCDVIMGLKKQVLFWGILYVRETHFVEKNGCVLQLGFLIRGGISANRGGFSLPRDKQEEWMRNMLSLMGDEDAELLGVLVLQALTDLCREGIPSCMANGVEQFAAPVDPWELFTQLFSLPRSLAAHFITCPLATAAPIALPLRKKPGEK